MCKHPLFELVCVCLHAHQFPVRIAPLSSINTSNKARDYSDFEYVPPGKADRGSDSVGHAYTQPELLEGKGRCSNEDETIQPNANGLFPWYWGLHADYSV